MRWGGPLHASLRRLRSSPRLRKRSTRDRGAGEELRGDPYDHGADSGEEDAVCRDGEDARQLVETTTTVARGCAPGHVSSSSRRELIGSRTAELVEKSTRIEGQAARAGAFCMRR